MRFRRLGQFIATFNTPLIPHFQISEIGGLRIGFQGFKMRLQPFDRAAHPTLHFLVYKTTSFIINKYISYEDIYISGYDIKYNIKNIKKKAEIRKSEITKFTQMIKSGPKIHYPIKSSIPPCKVGRREERQIKQNINKYIIKGIIFLCID